MKEILREGKKVFIASFLLFAVFLGLYIFYPFIGYLALSLAGLFFFGYTVFFLRLPKREVKADPDVIYASADGYVLEIEENIQPQEYLDGPAHKIVIFMHVASMHWNLAPIEGEIDFLEYKTGRLGSALSPASWKENEHQLIGIKNDKNNVKVLVAMIAGLIARRIRFFRKKGDSVVQGERFGLIKYGSANILYIPAEFKIQVEKGQKSRAGKTIIARRNV
jgi:phosphatidylserine decarboxylase